MSVLWMMFIGGMVAGFFLGVGATIWGIQWLMGADANHPPGPRF